jgi:hypothetical protein
MPLVGRDEAFQHDLGMGREGQAGEAAAHHLGRAPAHAAHDVELEHPVGGFHPAVEERDRIAAQHHHDRHRLAALEVLVAMKRAVMALGHHDADRIAVVHLRPVGAGIEPALLRIARDAVGAGADVAAAVLLVPDRRGKFGHVDVVAQHDVLEHRAVLDDLMDNDGGVLEIGLAVGVAELPLGEVVGKAERHVAAGAGEHVEQQAKTLRAAWDVLEHHARTVLGAQHRLGGEPDILLPAGAAHGTDLAEPVGQHQPFAQIVIGDMGRDVARFGHAIFSCLLLKVWPATCFVDCDEPKPALAQIRSGEYMTTVVISIGKHLA